MDKELNELLEKHHLKKTGPRFSVLSILKSRNMATSQPILEGILGKDIDRVTLYRTLSTFEEKGIIHKVIDQNGTANYALCHSLCTEHEHKDEHVHFNCKNCLQVYCLDTLQIPHMTMPEGFIPYSSNFIIYGICKTCSEKL